MTIESLLRAFRARWYVLVLGIVVTVFAGQFAMRPAPLFWTQAEVLVLAPGMGPQDIPGDLVFEGMTTFAGMMEREMNTGDVLKLNSASAPLYGAGVRDGYSVILPNSGNQWTNVFDRPVLSVEVVASDPATVARRYDELIDQLTVAGRTIQEAQGVAPSKQMTLRPVLDDPPVVYVGPTKAEKLRSVGAVALIGTFVSAGVAVLLDSRRRRVVVIQSRPPRGQHAAPRTPERVP